MPPSQVEPKFHPGWWRCFSFFHISALWRCISCAQVISWDAVTSLSVEQSFPPSSRLTTLPASALVSFSNPPACHFSVQLFPQLHISNPPPLLRRHSLLPFSYLLLHRRPSRTRSRLPSVAKKCGVDESPRGPALLFNTRTQVSPLSRVTICKFLGVSHVCVVALSSRPH